MTQSRHSVIDPTMGRAEPLFGQFDVVALAVPWHDSGLPIGVWGTVLAVHENGTYHVEFTAKDGTTLLEATVAEGLLRLVWSEPT